jgi:hypothetical protein
VSIFKSTREKQLWLYTLAVLVAIISTLVFGRPLSRLFGNQNIQAAIFMTGMVLIGAAIVIHAIKTQPNRAEMSIWLGLAAVCLLFVLRLGLPERSHVMEYSVLAICLQMALVERVGKEKTVFQLAFLAFVITFVIGVLDEFVQIFITSRVLIQTTSCLMVL